MFENIIEQSAASQLRRDIMQNRLAPSMLFFGPPDSGKGSCALELARSLSCTQEASWKCTCSSCESYRYLGSSDLLMLGKKNFLAEISTCGASFLRNPSIPSVKILFIRSVRKLQMRFSPVLTEGDSKLGSLVPVLQSLEEKTSELLMKDCSAENNSSLEKLTASIIKDASVLAAGVSSNIPVEHIRRAAYWCYLAPFGKRKILIIENADNMRDDARNSLLKLLEEPPQKVNIVLTTQRREAVIATILSRVRPYRFLKRSAEGEKDVIRRVFQLSQEEADKIPASSGTSLISAYLNSFLAYNTEKMRVLAVFFIVSAALITENSIRTANRKSTRFITMLIESYAPIAEKEGFKLTLLPETVVKTLLEKSTNFEDGSFPSFLKSCLDLLSEAARNFCEPQYIACNDIFKKYIGEALTASETLNQSKVLVIEALLYNLHKNLRELF